MTQLEDLTLIHSVVKMPLMPLPVTSVAVKLKSGTVLISPGSQLTDEQLKNLSNVTDLVASNALHSAGIPKANAAHPNANVWGVPGLEKRKPEMKWTHVLKEGQWKYQEELPAIFVKGAPAIKEVVFYHKPSKSLIVTDLCFNMTKVSGFGAWIILNLFGTYKKFGVSKFFARYIKDKAAFESSLKEILAYDFDKIIVSHGEIVTDNAKEKLRQAMALRGLNAN